MDPIALIYTDFHIKPDNVESVSTLCKEAIQIANKYSIENHIWLGDVFDNRVSQRESVLNGLTQIIEMYDKVNHRIYCIPGNHDKTDYSSRNSFLHPYKYHPSFDLIDDLDYRMIGGKECFFLPFFSDEIMMENIECFAGSKDFLFGHFAVTGSKNNDGSEVESRIKPSLFKTFKKVFLGHYHNQQDINPNIIHLGSLQQNNFGEDDRKGFWLLYSDGTIELITSKIGQTFKKLKIDLSNLTQKQAVSMIDKFKEDNPGARLRVEVCGETAAVKAFDKTRFQGIDIKKKYEEIDVDLNIDNIDIKTLSQQDIIDKFKLFCEENEYNYNEGLIILKEILCQ